MFDVRTIPGAEALNDAFVAAGFELRLVGGAVRDIILGETPKDFDFATDATPAEMRVIAKTAGFGCIATGEQHGTMTLVVEGEPFEVTTLRIDVETNGRHAEVEFTRSFEKDAARRDLTFNAMSMDFDGNLFDYFDGQKDLTDRKVRFVGDPRQRVEEDYLRILRFFRFAARFNAAPEDDVLAMFMDPAIRDGLRKISVERYWQEMSKLFMAETAPVTLMLMQEYKVLETIGITGPFNLTQFMRATNPASKLSTFMPDDQKEAEEFCRAWKLSRDVIDWVVWLVGQRNVRITHEAVEDLFVDGVDPDLVLTWIAMAETKDDAEFQEITNRAIDFGNEIPVFPVGGRDLMDEGLKPGPDMGQKLKDLRNAWMQSRFKLTKEELLARLERV